MRRAVCLFLAFALLLISVPPAFAQNDKAGSKDYPGLSRMPSYFIQDYQEKPFDTYTFKVAENGRRKDQAVEGHVYNIQFHVKDGATPAGDLQIIRNFQNAVRAVGGATLFDEGRDDRETTLRFHAGQSEVWVCILTRGGGKFFYMNIVEKQAMAQDVTLDAAAMASALNTAGSVAIYGIYFDTAKWELKPESEPALLQISKLLQQQPALKVFIVGHTDMVGDVAANLKLSQQRADSVVAALVKKYGIAAGRLTAFGNGSYAPIASNKTEEGRARNRRVELVEIATK
jgi:outer membrane protein OmpA-like peptidoglycan-associated protein